VGDLLRFLSVCSGIEAASVAWRPLGWEAVAFSEIEKFPSAVLAHHYPSVPNWGDMTRFKDWPDAAFDLLVGGTPCQSFSVAGLRKGLDDPRGSLMLVYLALAQRSRPRWLVWENVPGVLSADGGRAFGSLLGGLAELGYGFAYRVLDAQYFGLAQRRQRVFVVGCLGDWRRAAAVLFERESLSGHPAPRREAGQSVATSLAARTRGGGGLGTDAECDGALIPERSLCLNGGGMGRIDAESETLIPTGGFFDGPIQALTNLGHHGYPSDRGDGAHLIAFSVKDHGADAGELAPTLRAGGHHKSHANAGVMPAIAFDNRLGEPDDVAITVRAQSHGALPMAPRGMQVRRLTPRECERLQGFPDDYTLIPYRGKLAADGPRYKALGNSMAVPVMQWIGRRIQMVEAIETERCA
jgi:DNA (cytosine-5)-methyltransferase 1